MVLILLPRWRGPERSSQGHVTLGGHELSLGTGHYYREGGGVQKVREGGGDKSSFTPTLTECRQSLSMLKRDTQTLMRQGHFMKGERQNVSTALKGRH